MRWALLACAMGAAAVAQEARFLNFAEVRETLGAFGRTEDAASWDLWVREQDREVRARIERGVEDSISNLVLYGTSFTKLPRAESPDVEATRARLRAAAVALAN